MRPRNFASFVVFLLSLFAASLRAENDDKAILFNTFYLDGEKPTYVLTIRTDKTFDLYGPDNEHISGNVRASGEHVTLTAGEVKRMFHYDSTGRDIKLGRRDGDTPVKGNLLGEMPPAKDGVFRTVYINENNWRKKGRPLIEPGGRRVEPKPEPVENRPPPPEPPAHVDVPAPKVETVKPVETPAVTDVPADIAPIGNFEDLAGTYTVKNAEGRSDTLVVKDDGYFVFARADGMKQSGALMRADPDLSFVASTGKRHFTMQIVASGVELTRRDADVVKPGEVLGSMPPQERAGLVWLKKDAPAPASTRNSTPAPAPKTEPVKVVDTPPAKVEEKPSAKMEPAPVAAGAAVSDVKQMAGTFVHKPSPFISETIAIKEDGSFNYKDSNGANVNGTTKIDGGKIVMTSGEVVRIFTATVDDKGMTLARVETDNPKFKNDLASMSPTVLKTAKYEKK